MIKYLLDTNICVYIINRRPPQVRLRFEQESAGSIAVSALTVAELAFGVQKSAAPARNREILDFLLSPLQILPFDRDSVWDYGSLRSELMRQGKPIGPIDMLIAAHAISLNLTLVTNNTSEFARVPGLRCENWISPAS